MAQVRLGLAAPVGARVAAGAATAGLRVAARSSTQPASRAHTCRRAAAPTGGKRPYDLFAPLSIATSCVMNATANAREWQCHEHEQKRNATALLSLPFKRSGTTHKRSTAPTLYSNEGRRCFSMSVVPRVIPRSRWRDGHSTGMRISAFPLRWANQHRIHHRENPDRECDQGATGMSQHLPSLPSDRAFVV